MLQELIKRPTPLAPDGIVFVGDVRMDRDICRQLEIRAHCVSPARAALDDTRLGRTELQRLLGEWPERVVPQNALAADTEKKAAGRFELTRSARFLFGFDVDTKGNVYLPRQWITLLQLDDLAEPDKRQEPGEEKDNKKPWNFTGLEPIDLVKHQIQTLTRRSSDTPADEESKKKKTEAAQNVVRAAPLDRYSDR